MTQSTSLPPDDAAEIAEKVRSGEYFREARNMYDFTVHDPMTERYLYVLLTSLTVLIFLVAIVAVRGLYPLRTPVPFIVGTTDIVDDLPRIRSLLSYKGENASEALLRFMVQNYVIFREEYNIDSFDRNINGVKVQSSPEVFAEFQRLIDPRNSESPVALYQRHSKRTIEILSTKLLDDETGVEVVYLATVESKNDVKKSRWQTNIAFNYSGITLDEKTEKVKPVSFIVTQYRTKRLQDLK